MMHREPELETQAFRPLGRSKVTLLVQPRPRRNSAYVVFGDELDAPEVHIHVRVIEDLRRATLEAVPYETIGALLGRPCRDDYGVYVVVENALTAAEGEYVGTQGAVRISATGRSSMHLRAAERYPTLEPVGWWHSHPRGAPRYSSVDTEEQATYPRPHHVGIVVAAEYLQDRAFDGGWRREPLGVYVGPTATLLARRANVQNEFRVATGVSRVQQEPSTVPRGRTAAPQPVDGEQITPVGEAAGLLAGGWPPESPNPGSGAWWQPGDLPRWAGPVLGIVGVIVAAALAVMVLTRSTSMPQGGPNEIVSEQLQCLAGTRERLPIDPPASSKLASDSPEVAVVRVRGSSLAVSCKRPGDALLTIGGKADGTRVAVRVLPPSQERPG